ncbi:MAG: replication factor C large subunit [Methanobacterium sp.]|jgi:replication factor C large subunit
MLWTNKYSPKNFKEVLGNNKAKDEISEWIDNWLINKPQKPLLLVGPPGTGKTTLAHLAAHEFADHIELNASDKRSYDILLGTVGEASATGSLFNQGLKLIILDEVDGIHGTDDRGGIRAITKIIKEGHHPLVMMANDPYSKRIKSLKSKCQVISIRKVHTNSIVALLKKICLKEGVEFEEYVLRTLAKRSNGDLRSAINDLEIIARGKESITTEDLKIISQKDDIHNIFDSVRTVLKSKNPQRIKDAMRVEADPAFMLELITENIPREYEKKHEIQNAYEMISKADIYLGRAFQTRNYGYWKYSYDLMSLGVALSKDETYKKFARYTNSTVYAMLSKSRAKRDLQDRVAAKIGEKTHTSLKVAKQQFPYLEIMFQNNEIAWELAEYFRLENDEVKLFRSRKIKKPKTVQSKTIQEENQVKKVSNSKKIVDKKIKEKITSIHPPVKKIKSTQNKESIKKEDKIEDSKSKSNKKVSKSKSKEKQVSLFSFK